MRLQNLFGINKQITPNCLQASRYGIIIVAAAVHGPVLTVQGGVREALPASVAARVPAHALLGA